MTEVSAGMADVSITSVPVGWLYVDVNASTLMLVEPAEAVDETTTVCVEAPEPMVN
jgi:hypothetical protein